MPLTEGALRNQLGGYFPIDFCGIRPIQFIRYSGWAELFELADSVWNRLALLKELQQRRIIS